MNAGLFADAVRTAVKMSSSEKILEVFDRCTDVAVKKQMALILGRHGVTLDLKDDSLNELVRSSSCLAPFRFNAPYGLGLRVAVQIGNTTLTAEFASLARELDVVEAKTPEDIYKSHLAQTASTRNRDEASQVCYAVCCRSSIALHMWGIPFAACEI